MELIVKKAQKKLEAAQQREAEAQKEKEAAQQKAKAKAIRLAIRMLKDGESIADIIEETELTEAEILGLKSS